MTTYIHQRPIDKEFEDADDTGVLVLSGRNLRTFPVVPGDLYDANYIFEADFSKNRFDRIPDELCDFGELVKLNCYHNSIRYVPEDLNNLSNLTELNLSRNFLQSIPPQMCTMTLYSLDLSNNRLVSLPIDIGKMCRLRYLNLSCNMLPDLPHSITDLHSLLYLDLHRNELTHLPEDIFRLQVTYLDVSANSLTRLPTTLRLMDCLHTFLVNNNPLDSPPTQVCMRGLVHIFKYLENLEKRGSDPQLISISSREESLRRRKDRSLRKDRTSSRPYSESTPIGAENGRNRKLDFYKEMQGIVSTAFTEESPLKPPSNGDLTPTSGAVHWTFAQYVAPDQPQNQPAMSSQSKEEYRKAAHQLYLDQQRQKSKGGKNRSSSPPLSTQSPSSPDPQFNTLPKRKGAREEGEGEGGKRGKGRGKARVGPGRSLPGETYARPGSWNTHMKRASPVLPSKYSTPDPTRKDLQAASEGRFKNKKDKRDRIRQASKSATDLRTPSSPPAVREPLPPKSQTPPLQSKSTPTKSKPPPLDMIETTPPGHASPHAPGSPASSRSGSVTPTNIEESLEEPTTPKQDAKRTTHSLEDLSSAAVAEGTRLVAGSSSADNLFDVSPVLHHEERTLAGDEPESVETNKGEAPKRPPPPSGEEPKRPPPPSGEEPKPRPMSDIQIEELEEEPRPLKKKRSASTDAAPGISSDSTWPRLKSPHRKKDKKDKDVFRFLKGGDPNYTVRRQQFQMSIILEKNRFVKTKIEALLEVTLPDDIGEWIADGVMLCKLVNRLRPGTIPMIHTPTEGLPLSNAKQTMNIAAFINACRLFKVPEDELCSAGDIIELRDPIRVITCLQRLLEGTGSPPPRN